MSLEYIKTRLNDPENSLGEWQRDTINMLIAAVEVAHYLTTQLFDSGNNEDWHLVSSADVNDLKKALKKVGLE